jgi:hypothetical protein
MCLYDYVTHNFLQGKCNQKDTSPTLNASKATYRFVQEHKSPTVSVKLLWKHAKHHRLEPLHHENIITLLITNLFQAYSTPPVEVGGCAIMETPFFTEYERNGFVYRPHPTYQGNGAYYDWAQVRWETGIDAATGEPIFAPFIGQILGFIAHPSGNINAIIHSVLEDLDGLVLDHGIFGNYWHLEVEGTDALQYAEF